MQGRGVDMKRNLFMQKVLLRLVSGPGSGGKIFPDAEMAWPWGGGTVLMLRVVRQGEALGESSVATSYPEFPDSSLTLLGGISLQPIRACVWMQAMVMWAPDRRFQASMIPYVRCVIIHALLFVRWYASGNSHLSRHGAIRRFRIAR
jgi:hypothetical protein